MNNEEPNNLSLFTLYAPAHTNTHPLTAYGTHSWIVENGLNMDCGKSSVDLLIS